MTPAMCPNCRSSGVATEDAMMSGLRPGSDAATVMVGKSTCGSGDTGSTVNAIAPASATATVSSVVATGRCDEDARRVHAAPSGAAAAGSAPMREARAQIVEEDVDHRRGVQRQHLAEDQAADHRDAQRLAQLRADARAERQRNAAEQRRHGGHHDRPEAQQATPDRSRRWRSCLRCARLPARNPPS